MIEAEEDAHNNDTASSANSPIAHPEAKPKNRRKRKSDGQVNVLKEEFYRNSSWTKEQVQYLSRKTGLSEAQVYKWGWDFRKKLKLEAPEEMEGSFECEEILYPCPMDNTIWLAQQSFRLQYSMPSVAGPSFVFLASVLSHVLISCCQYDTSGQADGMHIIGPPMKAIVTKLFHHMCSKAVAGTRA